MYLLLETISLVIGGGYDFIVARHVFEHTANPISFLANVNRSLKMSGYLYMAVPNAMKVNQKKASSFF